MDKQLVSADSTERPRVGRPRRGTQAARTDTLIAAATRVFLRDGYAAASIDKVASEAGVSTRTIYERFKNKADLLAGVVTRLVENDMQTVLSIEELERLEPRQALMAIGRRVAGRACESNAAALFRICAVEAHRFPLLAAKMRFSVKLRLDDAVANYLRRQADRGVLDLEDPERAARLFMQMVCTELHDCLLFGTTEELAAIDSTTHVQQVVDIFLNGARPRPDEVPKIMGISL